MANSYYSVGMNPMDTAYLSQMQGMYPMYAAPNVISQPQVANTISTAPEEPKKSNAGTILLVGGTLSAAALCIAGFKKGNVDKKGLSRIWDGVTTMFKGIKGSSPKHKTIEMINDKRVITLPGEKNIIKGGDASKLEEIGLSKPNLTYANIVKDGDSGKLAEGNTLRSFVYSFKKKGDKEAYKIIVSGDKITIFKNVNKKATHTIKGTNYQRMSIEKFKNDCPDDALQVQKIVSDIRAGKTPLDNSNIERFVVRNTNADTGLISTVKYTNKVNNGTTTTEEELISCVSDKFGIESDKVWALRSSNSALDAACKETDLKKLSIEQGFVENSFLGGQFILNGSQRVIGFRPNGKKPLEGEALAALLKKEEPLVKNAEKMKPEEYTHCVYRAA